MLASLHMMQQCEALQISRSGNTNLSGNLPQSIAEQQPANLQQFECNGWNQGPTICELCDLGKVLTSRPQVPYLLNGANATYLSIL